MHRAFAATVAAAALLGGAAGARAEATATSVISQIRINEQTDNSFKLYRGSIWLDYDKAQNTYRWGGKQCANLDLSDASVRMLFDAFQQGFAVTLEFKTTVFQEKRYRCITAFTVTK